MRKATWGAIALGVFALMFGSPIRDIRMLHSLLSLAGLAGYLLLSWDPPSSDVRFRKFLLAGVIASVAAFILAFSGAPYPLDVVARILAVATVALPLWLVARPPQFVFVAAAALAFATVLPALSAAGGYATSTHAYVAAAGAFWVAWLIHNPMAIPGQKKPPRVVTAHDVVFLSPQEKAERLAALEKRFQAGEIPEHKYWDKRQEIESR
ncbi:MAG TPA: hypothetical protein VM327_04885 [Candidatus Thermoplasmatota archaeon]|nr:hypothetical protein [Candidatus Thermoplasmatota archaeon]